MAKKKARKERRKQREKERAEREKQWHQAQQAKAEERAEFTAQDSVGPASSSSSSSGGGGGGGIVTHPDLSTDLSATVWDENGWVDTFVVPEAERQRRRSLCDGAMSLVREGVKDAEELRLGAKGQHLLEYALSNGFVDVARELVYELDVCDCAEEGALSWAAASGCVETMEFVLERLEHLAGSHLLKEKTSEAVLRAVVEANAGEDVLRVLKEAGADLDAVVPLIWMNAVDATALNMAVRFGRHRSLRALLKLGANDMFIAPVFYALSKCDTILELAADGDWLVRTQLVLFGHYLGHKVVSEKDLVYACLVAIHLGKFTMRNVKQQLSSPRLNCPKPAGISLVQLAVYSHAARVAELCAKKDVPLEGEVLASSSPTQGMLWVMHVLDAAERAVAEALVEPTPAPKPPHTPAVCFLWSKYATCKYGDACLFAHAESSRPANPPSAPFQHASSAVRARAEDLAALREVLEPHVVDGVFPS